MGLPSRNCQTARVFRGSVLRFRFLCRFRSTGDTRTVSSGRDGSHDPSAQRFLRGLGFSGDFYGFFCMEN